MPVKNVKGKYFTLIENIFKSLSSIWETIKWGKLLLTPRMNKKPRGFEQQAGIWAGLLVPVLFFFCLVQKLFHICSKRIASVRAAGGKEVDIFMDCCVFSVLSLNLGVQRTQIVVNLSSSNT